MRPAHTVLLVTEFPPQMLARRSVYNRLGYNSVVFGPFSSCDTTRRSHQILTCPPANLYLLVSFPLLFQFESNRKYIPAEMNTAKFTYFTCIPEILYRILYQMPVCSFQTGKVPGPYLALLEDISATALIVVLSVPTFRERRHPEPCAKVLLALAQAKILQPALSLSLMLTRPQNL